MSPFAFARPRVWGVLLAVLLLAGCGSSHHLARYDFQDRTVAVVANIPPSPDVDTAAWLDGPAPGQRGLLAFVARTGTAIAKEVQAHQVRGRLDEAAEQVDVADRIARRALDRSVTYLGARPVNDPRQADYLLDVQVRRYGIEAKDFQSQTYFKLVAEVQLLDAATGRRIWKTKVRETEPLTPFLVAGRTVQNVVTAEAFSRLTVEELTELLEGMSDYTADHVTRRLRNDLAGR